MITDYAMDQRENWEAIVAEISRRNAAGESFEAISKMMGAKTGGTLAFKIHSGVTTGERINADKVRRYMRGLGLPIEDTLPPVAPPEGFGFVRRVRALLGAGSSLVTDDEPDGVYAFRLDFLNRLGLRAKPVLFGVIGDSMEPTLKNGDTVLIDEADKTIRAGQLYGVGIGEELHIKRVFVKPDGTVVLKSDNQDHPTWEIPKDERPRIIGRARWVGRIL
jgi:hypothetical protein